MLNVKIIELLRARSGTRIVLNRVVPLTVRTVDRQLTINDCVARPEVCRSKKYAWFIRVVEG